MTNDILRLLILRALKGQTPPSLLAISFSLTSTPDCVLLKAHFDRCPSNNEIEMLMDFEGEIIADFNQNYTIDTEIELISPTHKIHSLSGGFGYQRE